MSAMLAATGDATPRPLVDVAGFRRARPLALVCTPDADIARQLMSHVSALGMVACVTRSAAGCLRVATAIGPDLLLLDARLPDRLEGMLGSHPATSTTTVIRI
jgi:DNA-binding response OmpR family regulator